MTPDESLQQTLIVLLGNENEPDGTLKQTAILRAEEAIKLLQSESNSIVIPTGTFGAFNEANIAHGELLTQHLESKGIARERILPYTKSTNTLEDAYAVLRYLELEGKTKENMAKVVVVTSAFHMARVEFIFGRVIQDIHLEFREAPNPGGLNVEAIGATEKSKLDYLKRTWVNVGGFDLNAFPTDSYNNASSELRHYDNLSQFALTGAAVLFGLAISGDFKGLSLANEISKPDSNQVQEIFLAFMPLFIIAALTILIFLYHKFADTAASSRRVLYTIERLYLVPGLSSTRTHTKFLGISLQAQKAVDWLYYMMISLLMLIFFAKLIIALFI